MFESGYARGVNTTLAALPGFAWPGDLSPARSYLGDDLVPGPSWHRIGPRWRSGCRRARRGRGLGPPPDLGALEERTHEAASPVRSAAG